MHRSEAGEYSGKGLGIKPIESQWKRRTVGGLYDKQRGEPVRGLCTDKTGQGESNGVRTSWTQYRMDLS